MAQTRGGVSPPPAPGFTEVARSVLQQRLQNPSEVRREYMNVLEKDRDIDHGSIAAVSGSNSSKNRYVNVLPYDHNRVSLGTPACDYINASAISHSDPAGFDLSYIATQGPMPATTADFWQMVYEQRVGAIVMLTNLMEKGHTKCGTYYPQREGDAITVKGIEVRLLRSERLQGGELSVRTFLLTHIASGQVHQVRQLHYHAWPDHGTPEDTAAIRSMCDLLSPVRQEGQQVVVHCSAGIGRTGTFCALDIVRLRFAAFKAREAAGGTVSAAEVIAALDLIELVHGLRQQRVGMVQTEEQYMFIYHALLEELNRTQ